MGMLEDVAEFLGDQGLGTPGDDIFIGTMPDRPAECIAVYEYTGETPTLTLGPGPVSQERPRLQVVGRGARYEVVRAKVVEAWTVLQIADESLVVGQPKMTILPLGSVMPHGRDENNLIRIGANFSVWRDSA